MHGPLGQFGFESNAPVSEVTLWIDCPVFVHTTVVPALTVIDAGEKPKSTIETCTVAAGVGAGAPVTGEKGFVSGAVGDGAVGDDRGPACTAIAVVDGVDGRAF